MSLHLKRLPIEGLILITPRLFEDARGRFLETFNEQSYLASGIDFRIKQTNICVSTKNVLRGLHFQNPKPQGKIVGVTEGEIFDVAVDLRKTSPTYLKWQSEVLSEKKMNQFLIPEGFAHGFLVLSERACIYYLCENTYDPATERSIRFDDPQINIQWPHRKDLIISSKDQAAPLVQAAPKETFFN